MFTGIIESTSEIVNIEKDRSNLNFTVKSSLASELKVDQSVAHNGVCLTVTDINKVDNTYKVTAIDETLKKTNLGEWRVGSLVNLERALRADQRIDGHFVQGHVDTTGACTNIVDSDGSKVFEIEYEMLKDEFFTVPKGSICLNGVSLTVVDSGRGKLSVAIIPYTFEHTNFSQLKIGDKVNIEFDILGKYITGLANLRMLK